MSEAHLFHARPRALPENAAPAGRSPNASRFSPKCQFRGEFPPGLVASSPKVADAWYRG